MLAVRVPLINLESWRKMERMRLYIYVCIKMVTGGWRKKKQLGKGWETLERKTSLELSKEPWLFSRTRYRYRLLWIIDCSITSIRSRSNMAADGLRLLKNLYFVIREWPTSVGLPLYYALVHHTLLLRQQTVVEIGMAGMKWEAQVMRADQTSQVKVHGVPMSFRPDSQTDITECDLCINFFISL